MPPTANPRIAVLGFSIECNKFAPPATKAHFLARTYLEGEAILEEARRPTPTMLPETPGFVAAMDKAGPWTPVGIALAMSEPNGPVEHGFFEELLDTITRGLKAALPVDGVYFCAHGAAITTAQDDPGDHECVGDGRVCLCRHRQERAQRHRDRARRRGGRGLARRRDRAIWLGQPLALLPETDFARRGGAEGALGRARSEPAGACLCRCRRQSRRRRARQPRSAASRS